MKHPAIAALALLLAVPGHAQSKPAVPKIVLPPEPPAQVVTQKIDLLELFRRGESELFVNPKGDIAGDPKSVFKFAPDGNFVVSGEGYGAITTLGAYRDYHLVIEFMWGQKTWGRRESRSRDSGILVHCYGPQGAVGGNWMASIEAQIIEGGVGDILVLSPKLADGTVLLSSLSAEVGRDRDKEKVWTPGAPRETMTGGRLNWSKRDPDWKDVVGYRGKDDVESPFGKWTRFEVIAKGDTLQYFVNGVKVNEAFDVKPSQGRLQLQTEAAEMHVRRYELHPLGGFTEKWDPAKAARSAAHPATDGVKPPPASAAKHGDAQEIPGYAFRPSKLDFAKDQARNFALPHRLPVGFEMVVAAASPMVANPTMGCVDDRGRLFVGDSIGVNWSTKKFEQENPGRVVMLEDRDGDGVFDRSTVFADGLTVPKGGCWADGSLFVASPPGIWRFTDADDDGVAEKRELVVGGFAWTANGADCHGPRLHPDGRLYWTHGRKGHVVKQKDGAVVHEGLNSGIWSMKTDGTDIRWHSLGCADNPTGLDFTPTGELVGTTNLYFGFPRVDTIMQWQLGGVYERPDYLRIIANLPRTHERMPILRELGHMVPSGSVFWRAADALAPAGRPWSDAPGRLQYMVSLYNSSKVMRYELHPEGAGYRADEHEFFTVDRKGAHLSDVIEAVDGSLLVVDTGTWYSHCPSSLLEGDNVTGAIYRIRRTAEGRAAHAAVAAAHKPFRPAPVKPDAEVVAGLTSADPAEARRALEAAAFRGLRSAEVSKALLAHLGQAADPVLEHAILHAAMTVGGFDASTLAGAEGALRQGRLIRVLSQTRAGQPDHADVLEFAMSKSDSADAALARQAQLAVLRAPDPAKLVAPVLESWIADAAPTAAQVAAMEKFGEALASKPAVAMAVTAMLGHARPAVRQAGLRAIAAQTGAVDAKLFAGPLQALLDKGDISSSLLLDAVAKVRDARFDAALERVSADESKPAAIRLKALLALSKGGEGLSEPAFRLLIQLLVDPANPGLRMDAARRLAHAKLTDAQLDAYLEVLPSAGPLEQNELLDALALPQIYRALNPDKARRIAAAFAKSPLIGTFRQDLVRKAFAPFKRDVFRVLEPTYLAALAANDAKKDRMASLAATAVKGDPVAGRAVYESGKGACIACHRVGDKGNEIGPNLSRIGNIRAERELIESIMFPSNNIARDYDLTSLQLTDGSAVLGIIRERSAEGVTLKEASGQSRVLPNESIASSTQLPTSLMPAGLDGMLSEKDLVDLVAFLRSLK
ncbi:MAG: PVC-type heme-binding CxxCH protein [Opitutales bacterium]